MKDSPVPHIHGLTETPEESVPRQFHEWERRGRGWQVHDFAVELEPPFRPFYIFEPDEPPIADDGRIPGFFGRLLEGGHVDHKGSGLAVRNEAELIRYEEYLAEADEPEFCRYYSEDFAEVGLCLPRDFKIVQPVSEQFLLSLAYCSSPVSFEVVGNADSITVQFASTERDASQLRQQLEAHFSGCSFSGTGQGGYDSYLTANWINSGESMFIADFGLSENFMLPLETLRGFETDPLLPIIGGMSSLGEGEVGVFQVLFQKVKNDWPREVLDAIGCFEGTGFFDHIPGFGRLAGEKLSSPLFAVVVRMAAKSSYDDRSMQILRQMSGGLALLSKPSGNELMPLSNDGYDFQYHEQALLDRQSFRCGMLLNTGELVSLVHPPSQLVKSRKLERESERTKPVPATALGQPLILGENAHQGNTQKASLSDDQRTRHIHLIGSSGSGKSTLLLNFIRQDLENGHGLCVIDPHGDLVDAVVGNVPDDRVDDVILFDPSDAEYPIGFNILQAKSELEKTILSSDLVATFRRMSTSWGDVMDSVLANAVLAFVENSRGGTLFDLKRFLVEKGFRDEYLKTVKDDSIRYFWTREFPLIASKTQASILIRLDAFLRQKLIRNIVCQRETKLNFREIMDGRKVLLVKLPQGLIGEENAYLLGTLLVSKIYQTALSRQETLNRPHFWLYVDEFHHFVTPSMENILSGSRKYNLGLALAHQEFRQLQSRNQEVASSVLSNCHTRICFRLGDADAEKFAGGFSFFDAKALQNLGVGEAIARVERADYDFNMTVTPPPAVPDEIAARRKDAIVDASRARFATPKSEVESQLNTIRESRPPEAPPQPPPAADKVPPSPSGDAVRNKPKAQPAAEVGSEHRYLQNIIKRIGESEGFVATIEKEVFGGVGKIDVALENENHRIACEIAVTNTTEYEVLNIRKCLSSGFDRLAVISSDTRRLQNIRKRAELVLSPVHISKVHFLEPENFHLFLESLSARRFDDEPEPQKVKGYTIKTEVKEPSPSEAVTKKNVIADILSRVMRRKKSSQDK